MFVGGSSCSSSVSLFRVEELYFYSILDLLMTLFLATKSSKSTAGICYYYVSHRCQGIR